MHSKGCMHRLIIFFMVLCQYTTFDCCYVGKKYHTIVSDNYQENKMNKSTWHTLR